MPPRRTSITRSEIGPNTDLRVAALALADYLFTLETRENGEASADLDAWVTGKLTSEIIKRTESIGRARRLVAKSNRRYHAAKALRDLAVAHADGRVHIMRDVPATVPPDAPKQPTEARTATKTPENTRSLPGGQ